MGLAPNLCTAANLLLGVLAIAAITNNNYKASVVLIVLAALLDRFDGTLARRYNAVTAFGKEFDSLADLVSFGVAPGLLLYTTTAAGGWGYIGLACFALFVLGGAFRLARFNVSGGVDYFQGVPITFAGAVLAVLIVIIPGSPITLGAALFLALGMVSTVRIPKI